MSELANEKMLSTLRAVFRAGQVKTWILVRDLIYLRWETSWRLYGGDRGSVWPTLRWRVKPFANNVLTPMAVPFGWFPEQPHTCTNDYARKNSLPKEKEDNLTSDLSAKVWRQLFGRSCQIPAWRSHCSQTWQSRDAAMLIRWWANISRITWRKIQPQPRRLLARLAAMIVRQQGLRATTLSRKGAFEGLNSWPLIRLLISNRKDCELFIVEGTGCGFRYTVATNHQAVLRGKVLNTERKVSW